TRCGWSCPTASRPASSCCSTASSTASSTARTCAPRWPASSTTANAEGSAVGLLDSLTSWFGSGKGTGKRVDVAKRFDLLGRTGQGSMSKVWRARDRSLGKVVCLKLLDKQKTANFEARFKGLNKPREGEICTALRHENIVRTFEHGTTTTGEPFLVMEL